MTVTGKKSKINISKKIYNKKISLILLIYLLSLTNSYSVEPDVFVQSTVNKPQILTDNINKEKN